LLRLMVFCVIGAGWGICAEPTENGPVVKIEVAERQIAEGIQLLDVRTLEEWNDGYLRGAKLLDVSAEGFVEKATKLLDRDKPLLVYCRSGKRSERAASLLRAAGFSKVHEIEGGMLAWQAAGKPVVRKD
jgi:rhodanese-related sulfurtransferase